MGTRADFYLGRGANAQWIGSCCYDGYPDAMRAELLMARTEDEFRKEVGIRLAALDSTVPDQGWPWPWDTSAGTDYVYAFDDGRTWCAAFGRKWFKAADDEPKSDTSPKECVFPNMYKIRNVTLLSRSGLIILGS